MSVAKCVALTLPTPGYPFILFCDASDERVGGALTQFIGEEFQFLHFVSKKLTGTERRWSVSEKEVFAIVFFLEALERYIKGSKVIVLTDHQSLEHLRTATRRLSVLTTSS
eukprot:GHVP01042371.1.p1 GENE.GHVP01042371.1~~GHVP01042371.1.p1  ORF type:complete len:111 (+),score=13.85 GHVP01042371.1:506-838(+)